MDQGGTTKHSMNHVVTPRSALVLVFSRPTTQHLLERHLGDSTHLALPFHGRLLPFHVRTRASERLGEVNMDLVRGGEEFGLKGEEVRDVLRKKP